MATWLTYLLPLGLLSLLLLFLRCQEQGEEVNPEAGYRWEVPAHFPSPPLPADNPMTAAKVALGKQLFYEPALSLDSSRSCASCHLPQLAFTDGQALSRGIQGRTALRNAPPLFNLAWETHFFRDGTVLSLELQALHPLTDANEMGNTTEEIMARLRADTSYQRQFRDVFGEKPQTGGLVRALGAFQRTLISAGSPYDRWRATGDSSELSPLAWEGMSIFEAHCQRCHQPPLFAGPSGFFANNGWYAETQDVGRYRFTGDSADLGAFKPPSLRNLAFTAPYFHDGSAATLEAVLAHYAVGGKGHPAQHASIGEIALTAEARTALRAFLQHLNDATFSQNPTFRP